MREPTITCVLCGNVEVVHLTGRGYPPEMARKRLKARCKADGCPCQAQYLAGVRL